MRLIDADIIDDYLGDQADEWYESEERPGDDFMDGYCWVLNRLQDKKRFPTVEAIPIDFITEFKEDYCNAESEKCDIGIANALVELMLCWEDEQEGLEWRNDHERIPSKQQSVDAIPIEWIEQKMKELDTDIYEYEWLIAEWRIENYGKTD